ncbi:MAG: hypothetical protein NZ992_04890, partial [Candidatus Korarchaeum sp.]|nr:hypothetical protein [Candidatus Korarchaeum sp.]MDW8034934.1 hypothetical protein [Candidatus Korarchaeum sp.]
RVTNASEVIIADRVVYSFNIGENPGEIEIGKRIQPKVRLEPLKPEVIEKKVLAQLKRYEKIDTPRKEIKKESKVSISRSWDSLFDGKSGSRDDEGAGEPFSLPEIVKKEMSGSYTDFIAKIGNEFRLIRVNSYSGAVTADLPVIGPEELRRRILKAFADLKAIDPSEVEFLSKGTDNLYRLHSKGKSFLIDSEVELMVSPMIYHVRYEHASSEISILREEVDEVALRRLLADKFGLSDLSYECERSSLYVKAKKPSGWSFMLLDLRRWTDPPELEILVDRVFQDPRTSGYVIFCVSKESTACLTFWVSHDLKRAVPLPGSKCIDEIEEIVQKAAFSKFKLSIRMKADHERKVDSIVSELNPKVLFGVSPGEGEEVSLHFTGFDTTYAITLRASYSMRSGKVYLEEPRVSEDTPRRILERIPGLSGAEVLSYSYSYPFLQVRIRSEGKILTLKFDLSDMLNPMLLERKVHKGILSMLREALF